MKLKIKKGTYSSTKKLLTPSLLSAQIFPPWASTMLFAMDSPSPNPPSLVLDGSAR